MTLPTNPSNSDCSIGRADRADWPCACEWLFARQETKSRQRQTERLLQLLQTDEFDPNGLFVAHAENEIVGAALVQTQPGASAIVWPTHAQTSSIEDSLSDVALEFLRSHGVKQAQMLLPPKQIQHAEAWLRRGFRRVTRLQSLHRPVGSTLPHLKSRLHWTDADESMDEFMPTWLASHVGTLDCPELNGVRTAEDVIAGHHGLRSGAAWFLARFQGEPVGVLNLLRGEAGIVELDYLGLRPESRGKGLGRELLRRALQQAQAWNGEWIRLSVDVRNGPALQLYEEAGFQPLDELAVFLWTVEPESNAEISSG